MISAVFIELNIYRQMSREFSLRGRSSPAGTLFAERQMIAFIPDALSCEYRFPNTVLREKPLQDGARLFVQARL